MSTWEGFMHIAEHGGGVGFLVYKDWRYVGMEATHTPVQLAGQDGESVETLAALVLLKPRC